MKKLVFNILGSFILLTAILSVGCKKDSSDNTAPVISITAPFDNQTFNYGDTIHASFNVSDNVNVSSITVSVADASFAQVLTPLNVTPTGKNASYSVLLLVNDIHLVSGTYFFQVNAFDGYQNNIKYKSISITGAPKKRRSYYYVTRPTISTVQVLKMDSNLVSSSYYSLLGDLCSTDISSYSQDIYTAGYMTGKVNAITLETPTLKWSLPVVNNSFPYFENVYNSGKFTYVSFYNGMVKGFDVNGNQRFNATATANYYPIKTFSQSNYLLAEEKDISSSTKKMIVFYLSTGLSMQECIMNQDVVNFSTRTSNEVFVFGNNGNQGVIEIYQIASNSFWSPQTLAPGKILSVVQIDADNYLIAHSNGTIYSYTYSNSNLIPFIIGVTATHMAYDDVNQELLVSQYNSIKKYNYVTAGLINSVPTTDTVCGLHILFNK